MKKKVGRKLFDGRDEGKILQKLEEAFMLGATDQEACIYADISSSALYEYQKKNPEFLERKKALKNLPTLRAKKTVVDRLDKDVSLAQWWLSRKHPEEFGESRARTSIETPRSAMNLVEEAKKRSSKYIESAAKYVKQKETV